MREASGRGPFQGVANIVRFNAPVYGAAAAVCVLGLLTFVFASPLVEALGGVAGPLDERVSAVRVARMLGASAALGALWLTASALLASYLTYDRSGLYTWACLDPHLPTPLCRLAHVHTGLDESSPSLRMRFPHAELHVFDASAPEAQPEPSIARARRLVPLDPGTVAVGLGALPLPEGSVDLLLLLMAAHEVRDAAARARWLATLSLSLRPGGRLIVVEHLRDLPNALAFHVGVLHFFSRRAWHRTFAEAGLTRVFEGQATPWLALFVLERR
jgi:hypothetical protein